MRTSRRIPQVHRLIHTAGRHHGTVRADGSREDRIPMPTECHRHRIVGHSIHVPDPHRAATTAHHQTVSLRRDDHGPWPGPPVVEHGHRHSGSGVPELKSATMCARAQKAIVRMPRKCPDRLAKAVGGFSDREFRKEAGTLCIPDTHDTVRATGRQPGPTPTPRERCHRTRVSREGSPEPGTIVCGADGPEPHHPTTVTGRDPVTVGREDQRLDPPSRPSQFSLGLSCRRIPHPAAAGAVGPGERAFS